MEAALSNSLEDYLEKIWEILNKKGVVHAIDIAESLKVKKPSVTSALRRLSSKGFINYQPYKPVTLTQTGEAAARKILERHIAIKNFFLNVLEIKPDVADELACSMEHLVTDTIVSKMIAFEKFVHRCPNFDYSWIDGEGFFCNIEDSKCDNCDLTCKNDYKNNKSEEEKMSKTLSDMKPGENGIVSSVSQSSLNRKKLAEMGIIKGRPVEIIKIAPLGDPIEIDVKGYKLSLRKEEAKNITVTMK